MLDAFLFKMSHDLILLIVALECGPTFCTMALSTKRISFERSPGRISILPGQHLCLGRLVTSRVIHFFEFYSTTSPNLSSSSAQSTIRNLHHIMAVTKLPRTRKGTPSQGPPLSWPNDTTIGPRRPRLGLLRHATHNRQ